MTTTEPTPKAIDEAVAGTCRACGQVLVHVPGEQTYHPFNVQWPEGQRCPALLPIGESGALSRRVPDAEFTKEAVMSTTYELGEWVQVWGQVVETDPHPEGITVRMESHNEGYRCLVRRDRVTQAPRPDFAPRCGAISLIEGTDTLRRCERVHGHDREQHRSGETTWTDRESAGWMEEQ